MLKSRPSLALLCSVLLLPLLAAGCGGSADKEARSGGNGAAARGGGGGPGGAFGGPGGEARAAVPVEVAPVVRRAISSFIETNGTLEAENDVDVVARTSGPVEELKVEEMQQVSKGQLLARLDQDAIRAQLEVSRVAFEEAKVAFERAERLYQDELLSREAYDQAASTQESARAQLESNQIQLDYTEIRAPFDGVISQRYVKLAQNVSNGTPLFRITSFDPLLCPIQVPERDLPLLRLGQDAYLTVEAWSGQRFPAKVLRISPVVDAATGTVRVTLKVDAEGKLRPGMFASVFVETETRPDALVIPKTALALESIGDTVYVAEDGVASRREVTLGFSEGDAVQVVDGVAEGEQVVVVGQDGLADGTPVEILGAGGETRQAAGAAGPGGAEAAAGPPGSGAGGERAAEARPPGMPDFSQMTPEQLERVKERMRQRGLSEEQIEERLRQAGAGQAAGEGQAAEGSAAP